jgi:glycosyltransferase involved in cell wall biosynthesis
MSYRTGHSRHSLTVVVMTYCHENLIERAINSVLGQTIGREVEIVISDDASSDGTVKVSRECAKAFDNVVVRSNDENMGVMRHYRKVISEITTEYVAILEGDDYFIDRDTLTDKIALFRSVPTLECVFSAYKVIHGGTGREDVRPDLYSPHRNGFLRFEELVECNHMASFSNCMYRTSSLRDVLDEASLGGYDWLVNLRIADRGPIGYCGKPGTAYVVHERGAWSSRPRQEQIAAEIDSLTLLKTCVAERHTLNIDQKIKRLLAARVGV